MFAETMTSLPTSSGCCDGGEERDAATERVAHDVGLLEPEVVDERGDVVGHELDVDRPIDVGGPAVALEIGDDDLVARREGRQQRPEHLARPEPAVEEDERPPGAVGLVVEVDAVDVGVLAGAAVWLVRSVVVMACSSSTADDDHTPAGPGAPSARYGMCVIRPPWASVSPDGPGMSETG